MENDTYEKPPVELVELEEWNSPELRKRVTAYDSARGALRSYEMMKFIYNNIKDSSDGFPEEIKLFYDRNGYEFLIVTRDECSSAWIPIQCMFLPLEIAMIYIPSTDFLEKAGLEIETPKEVEVELYSDYEDFYNKLNNIGRSILNDSKTYSFTVNGVASILPYLMTVTDLKPEILLGLMHLDFVGQAVELICMRSGLTEDDDIVASAVIIIYNDTLYVYDINVTPWSYTKDFKLKLFELATRRKLKYLSTKNVNFPPLHIGEYFKEIRLKKLSIFSPSR